MLALQEAFQAKEKAFAHVVKVGRTQLQDAVLTTLGREMGAYAEAFNRDRWRIYKCEERLRVVNLGGTAIGTGLAAPREFIFRVVDALREITGIGFARAENLVEATQNADVFVEVSGILKACATSLVKICGDLRLLSSGPEAGLGEIRLPAAPGRLLDHARQGQPGDPGGRQPGRDAGDGPRPGDRSRRGGRQPGAQPVPAAGRALPARELRPAGARVPRSSASAASKGSRPTRRAAARHVESSTATVTALVPAPRLRGREPRCSNYAREQRAAASRRRPSTGASSRAGQFDELTSPEAVCRLGSPTWPGKRRVTQSAPRNLRLHIGLFGRRNVGKSSLLNAITRQDVSIVSATAGHHDRPGREADGAAPARPGAVHRHRRHRRRGRARRACASPGPARCSTASTSASLVAEAGAWGSFEEALLAELARAPRSASSSCSTSPTSRRRRPTIVARLAAREGPDGAHGGAHRGRHRRAPRGACSPRRRPTSSTPAGSSATSCAPGRAGRPRRPDRQGGAEGPPDPPAGADDPRPARRRLVLPGREGARAASAALERLSRPPRWS